MFLYHNLISKCLDYKTKCNTLFYHENNNQKRTSTNSIICLEEFKDFMKLCKDYTKEPYSFLFNDTNLCHEIIH